MTISRSLSDWAQHRIILLDSNLLIFHPDSEAHRDILNKGQGSLEDQRKVLGLYREQIVEFYDFWQATFTALQGRLFITRMQLDLELSGWSLVNNKPDRYRSRFRGRRMPRGHLVRDFDSKTTRKAKNKLIQQLAQNAVINEKLKKAAKGLRRSIRDNWLARPIWQAALKSQRISGVDEDLLVNLIAAGALEPTTLVTKDRALRSLIQQAKRELEHNSWARSPTTEQLAASLGKAQFEFADYKFIGADSAFEVQLLID